MAFQSKKSQQGFSLIELVIVIVISGVLASMTTSILTLPIQAYVDTSRRATLTDTADSALRQMQREIRRALPNSIRVSPDQTAIEFLNTVDGGRYRKQFNNTVTPPTGDILDFSTSDTSFDVLGTLNNFADISIGSDLLVVFPLTTTGSNPYNGDNTTLITGGNATNLNFAAFQFPLQSPDQRFFVINEPITYLCDTTATSAADRFLFRYAGYPIQAAQPLPPATGEAIQANLVANCRFTFNAGTAARLSVVTIELTLTDDAGESVNLIHQVHLDNQP